jgi:hypothetical protein
LIGGDGKMDENLSIFATEEFIEISTEEIIETEPTIENTGNGTDAVEVIEEAEAEAVEVIEVEMEEGIGWSSGEGKTHSSLYDRNNPDQHVITSITGLREELDEIERLKTVYSNGVNVANYHKWEGGKAYDNYGYFVSLVPGTSTIKICDGSDILGVSVDSAGFIGGQDATVPRDNTYGLIATSGLVDVHCELEIKVGDYVVSNAQGYARKSGSNYGYRVLATEDKNRERYAVIALGVQADKINELGLSLGEIKEQVDVNYKNITSAVNVANQAYNKATETETSNKVMSDKVDGALAEVGEMSTAVENMGAQVQQAQVTSAQAKAIAESAATSAASMKNEAVESANSAAAQVGELTKTLEPLTTWTDPETGNKGASYLANYIDNGLATKTEIETVEDDLEHAKSAISQNAKSLQSLVVSIDKYSVGEYSTAHGLTLDQATSILEPDIIYVPTIQHKEEYSYVDGEETVKYEREFVPGYLYRWGELPNGLHGWITVDKYYSEDKLNTSAPSVYFSVEAPSVVGDFGYWYTNSDTVSEGYEPYTLYKWIEDNWVAVATLAGNVNNRSISQIRQTANEIALEVTNARGSAATLGARITDAESEVQSLAAWTKDEDGNQYNLATIKQTADGAGASIAQVVEAVGSDGKVNAASIITAVNNDTSGIVISANHINLKGQVTFESFDEDTRKQIEADTIDVQIWSSRGNIFKSRDIASILTCHVFKAGVDITDTLPNSAFTWEKINHDGSVDTTWTATPYGNHANAIQITSVDVFSRAVFNCAVEI